MKLLGTGQEAPWKLWHEIDQGKWILPINVKETLKPRMDKAVQAALQIHGLDSQKTALRRNAYLTEQAFELLDLIQRELEKCGILL